MSKRIIAGSMQAKEQAKQSVQAKEQAKQSVQTKGAVHIKSMIEQCEQKGKQMSKWPSILRVDCL